MISIDFLSFSSIFHHFSCFPTGLSSNGWAWLRRSTASNEARMLGICNRWPRRSQKHIVLRLMQRKKNHTEKQWDIHTSHHQYIRVPYFMSIKLHCVAHMLQHIMTYLVLDILGQTFEASLCRDAQTPASLASSGARIERSAPPNRRSP